MFYYDFKFGSDLLDMKPNAQETKDKLEYIKIKNFYA